MGLSPTEWVLLAIAAASVGFAKTALSGVGQIGVVLFATVLPARESTGALLPLLLIGDVIAVSIYRRHVDWPALLRLLPLVAVGVLVGVLFVDAVDDTVMRRAIGAILLLLLGIEVAQRWLRGRPCGATTAGQRLPGWIPDPVTGLYGWLAGFTTMVANSGGPAMSLYLLRMGLPTTVFIGTMAWFFLIVNAVKVPFSMGLGLITPASLTMNVVLAPMVVAGAVAGRAVIGRIRREVFERLVLLLIAVSATALLL